MKTGSKELEQRESREMKKIPAGSESSYYMKMYYNKCFSLLKIRKTDPIFYLKIKAASIRTHIRNNPKLTFQEKIFKIGTLNRKIIDLITNEVIKSIDNKNLVIDKPIFDLISGINTISFFNNI